MSTAVEIARWLEVSHKPIPNYPNEVSTTVHFPGGFRSAKASEDRWIIVPLFLNGVPVQSRLLTKHQMQAVMKRLDLEPLGFQDHMRIEGVEHQHWVAYTGQVDNLKNHPAAMWTNIGASEERQSASRTAPVRVIADAISISLRGMDTALAALSEFYFQRLVEALRAGGALGVRTATSMDTLLAVHVHSFVLHFGAARDYLGALIAYRAGLDFTSRKSDSLAGAIAQIRAVDSSREPLFQPFLDHGALDRDGKSIGWLEEFSALRNSLVHRRPYGHHKDEQYGRLREIEDSASLLTYERLLIRDNEQPEDVLRLLGRLYKKSMLLFRDTALACGHSYELPPLTDEDFLEPPEVLFTES